jgi:hypothetical protein
MPKWKRSIYTTQSKLKKAMHEIAMPLSLLRFNGSCSFYVGPGGRIYRQFSINDTAIILSELALT